MGGGESGPGARRRFPRALAARPTDLPASLDWLIGGLDAMGGEGDARRPGLPWAPMFAGVAAMAGLALLATAHGWPGFGRAADPEAAPALPPVPADARRLRAASIAPVLGPGQRPGDFAAFRDCADCLDMVALPGGTFTMGSPGNEPGRDHDEDQVRVTLPRFAISRFPVTRGQYAAFAAATGRGAEGGCVTDRAKTGAWAVDPLGTWRDPAFAQDDSHPVVCVDWDDARAYAGWMKARTGRDYRLPSEAEYEYANRAGTKTAYFWGQDGNAGCAHANIADAAAKRAFPRWVTVTCDDGYERTSPIGHFAANPWGLFDMTGNVWSWTADCYASDHASNPRDGRPYAPAHCDRRVVRGASWYFSPWDARAASRDFDAPAYRDGDLGFRLARTLSPVSR